MARYDYVFETRRSGRPESGVAPTPTPGRGERLARIRGRRGRAATVALAFLVLGSAAAATHGVGADAANRLLLNATLLLGVGLLVPFLLQLVAHRDPTAPRPPRRQLATGPPHPPEPPTSVQELASHCVICGRRLETLVSMRARVGSSCIRQHGPRPRMVPNPDHARWRRLCAAADVERAAEQVRLDAAHQRAFALHLTELSEWRRELESEAADARRQRRKAARRGMADTLWAIPAFAAGACTASAFAAFVI